MKGLDPKRAFEPEQLDQLADLIVTSLVKRYGRDATLGEIQDAIDLKKSVEKPLQVVYEKPSFTSRPAPKSTWNWL